ncbi:hypothetical protein [Paenibacillus flagellatus]|uniref:Bacterial HORMA domain-containing protein n=1 Tax=Paenibacillus flagellatus TaxID=2211139 RepID=A0A2V5KNP3_9BACL|nr:hypothetical protein [Paenibacillus flagellatus]PYI50006.1 hypothetical protein DLM86_31180 [Paenibacillus flagellatus]
MSYSFTRTDTQTVTYANVRAVNDKIIADLDYVLTLNPNVFTKDRLEGWKYDFYQWIYQGYGSAIKVQFYRNNECFYEIKYVISTDGSITNDQNTGRIRGNLEGASTYVQVEGTSKWYSLTTEQKQEFYDSLKLQWGPSAKTNYAAGLIEKMDKQYSSGSLGVQRSILE